MSPHTDSEAQQKGDLTKQIDLQVSVHSSGASARPDRRLQGAIRFNGGGHINHSIFWTNLAPPKKGGGGEPEGDLGKAIAAEFGSFAKFQAQLTTAAVGVQGSGWAWLGQAPTARLVLCRAHLCACLRVRRRLQQGHGPRAGAGQAQPRPAD
jgi:superoxide dismutase